MYRSQAMTPAKCLLAETISPAQACNDYVMTRSMLSPTESRDHDHDYTNLTQVPSTNTMHSNSTITPNTNTNTNTINMEGRSSTTENMQFPSDSRLRTKGSQKSRSRASSTSQRVHARSTSTSTAGNSTGRRPGLTRRTTGQTVASQQQQQMSPQKREQLILLHRESCRLFQDPNASAAVDRSSTKSFASPTASPTLQSQRSHSFPSGYDHDISDEDLLPSSPFTSHQHHHDEPREKQTQSPVRTPNGNAIPSSSNQVVIPATITEWTSPSTRRREYEKIDRNNKGFRRLWRRLTPNCLHAGDERVPFWEEEIGKNKNKKKNYEGSVRRFRMDIPDDEVAQQKAQTEKELGISPLVGHNKAEKGRWSCF